MKALQLATGFKKDIATVAIKKKKSFWPLCVERCLSSFRIYNEELTITIKQCTIKELFQFSFSLNSSCEYAN